MPRIRISRSQFDQEESDFIAVGYVVVAALALAVYNTLLDFSDELQFIWKRPLRRLGSILYLLARYGGIFLLLMNTLVHFVGANFDTTDVRVCNGLLITFGGAQALATAGVNGFLLVRAYVVSKPKQHSRTIIFFGGVAYLGCLGALLAQMAVTRCNDDSTLEQQTIIGLVATGFSLLLDLIVFITITIYMGFIWRWGTTQLKMEKQMLRGTFLRQGLFRFGIVLVWSLANLVSSLLLRPTIAGIDSPMENAISQILICRFQLDLIKQATSPGESITENSLSPLNIRFASRTTGQSSGPSSLNVYPPDRGQHYNTNRSFNV